MGIQSKNEQGDRLIDYSLTKVWNTYTGDAAEDFSGQLIALWPVHQEVIKAWIDGFVWNLPHTHTHTFTRIFLQFHSVWQAVSLYIRAQ